MNKFISLSQTKEFPKKLFRAIERWIFGAGFSMTEEKIGCGEMDWTN